jgi:hypothetical protein
VQLDHRPTKILIAGNSGTGKSTFATAVLLNSPATYKFVYDWEGEMTERIGFAPAHDADGLFEQLAKGWCIFNPDKMFPPEDTEDPGAAGLAWFTDWVFMVKKAINEEDKANGRPFSVGLFFCDELQDLCDAHSMPRGLRTILERGRRQGIDTLLAAQQPNVIHNRARNQITELVAFAQVDENAVTYFEDMGFDGDDIRNLDAGQWRLMNRRKKIFQWGSMNWKRGLPVIEGSKVLFAGADNSQVRDHTSG